MKIKFYLSLLTPVMMFATTAMGGELILDSKSLKILQDRIQKNPYYLKRGPFNSKIMPFEVGAPVTPFFKSPESGLAHRRYRVENNCFELTLFEYSNQARHFPCSMIMKDLFIKDKPEYHAVNVSDLDKSSHASFEYGKQEFRYILKAFVHTHETIERDMNHLNLGDSAIFPNQDFEVRTAYKGVVSLDSKKGLSVTQEYQLHAGKIGFMNEKTKNYKVETRLSPEEWVFSDGKGSVMILNHLLLPEALRNHLLVEEYEARNKFLELQSRSYQSPVCYRDDLLNPIDLDCHRIIFDLTRTVRLETFNLLLVDFKSGFVEGI